MVRWTWWVWSLILRTTISFSALTLSVGSFDPWKPVPSMTYDVFGGMLNPAQSNPPIELTIPGLPGKWPLTPRRGNETVVAGYWWNHVGWWSFDSCWSLAMRRRWICCWLSWRSARQSASHCSWISHREVQPTVGWLRGPVGRTSVSGWHAFAVLRSACSWWVTTYVGKPSATGQPTRPTQPFIFRGR